MTRSLGMAILLMTWVGLVAIGASGVVAAGMQAAWGPAFLAGDLPDVTYTPDRCADLEEYAPAGSSCRQAAALHHSDETVTYRLAAGVLGLLALGSWWLLRRRTNSADARLPAGMVASAGTALFGVVGLGLLAQGVELLLLGPDVGAGADLSAAPISLTVAAVFGVRLVRCLADVSARTG